MAALGIFLFFLFSYMLSESTLLSGTDDFFLPLIIRGIGMAFLFVPLTTLAIQDLKGREIGQGTGLNNMGRQLGGSLGMAALTTLIHIRNGVHRNNLLNNINDYNTAFTQKYNVITQNFIAKGYTFGNAKNAALKAIDGLVTKQTFLLMYTDDYWLVGYMMLFSIPLLLLQKHNKNIFIPSDAH